MAKCKSQHKLNFNNLISIKLGKTSKAEKTEEENCAEKENKNFKIWRKKKINLEELKTSNTLDCCYSFDFGKNYCTLLQIHGQVNSIVGDEWSQKGKKL